MLDYNPGLDIYIASRDRPVETLRAISALKLVDFGVPTRIIVSDNASSAVSILSNLPPGVFHLFRESCTAHEHFNLIISELNCEWFLFTHDDDEILPSLGDVFRKAIIDSEVNIVSGRSRIIGPDGVEVIDSNYEMRLRSADLLDSGSRSIRNFNELLFDYGTLLPASAIIMKTSLVKDGFTLNPDVKWASDFEYSLNISRFSVVRYRGRDAVMNYHLHGGNSVFISELPFVLPAQTLICRISEIRANPALFNSNRRKRLETDFKRAVLLAYEAGQKHQFRKLMEYVRVFEKEFNTRISVTWVISIFKFGFMTYPLRVILRFRRKFLISHKNSGI